MAPTSIYNSIFIGQNNYENKEIVEWEKNSWRTHSWVSCHSEVLSLTVKVLTDIKHVMHDIWTPHVLQILRCTLSLPTQCVAWLGKDASRSSCCSFFLILSFQSTTSYSFLSNYVFSTTKWNFMLNQNHLSYLHK